MGLFILACQGDMIMNLFAIQTLPPPALNICWICLLYTSNLKTPDLLGLPVVFNNNLPTDQILYGDFSKYTMVERESISIDKSEHVKFVEDQTGYRGKGRFDGKPTNKNAFVLVTLTDTPNA